VTLHTFVYDWLLTHGVPPSTAEIAEHFGIDRDAAARQLAALKLGKTVLLHPDSGEIWMAGPFAAAPTPYRVVGSRTSWWANCAWDMLGIAFIANERVRVESACTDCAAPISIDVDPHEAPRATPVVHFLVPARRWYDDIGYT
jgi:hypothetical protein